MGNALRLYHGSTWNSVTAIERDGIDVHHSRVDIDFGQGFYLTDNYRTAEEWAKRRQNQTGDTCSGILCYETDVEKIMHLCVTDIRENLFPWKKEIVAHRIYTVNCPADLIIGAIADNKMTRLMNAFRNHQINEAELLMELQPLQNKGNQYTFKTDRAIRQLHLLNVKKV